MVKPVNFPAGELGANKEELIQILLFLVKVYSLVAGACSGILLVSNILITSILKIIAGMVAPLK